MKTPIRHYFALARRLARVLAPPLLVSMVLLVAQPVLRAQTTVPFEYFNFEGGLAVGPYTGSGAVVEIPESIEGQPVTRILPNAFRASQVTHVLVPSSVKFIENGAFADCPALVSVSLGNGVREIGERAFVGSPRLAEISVGPFNRSFKVVEGALLNWSGTILLRHPPAKQGVCVVPEGVVEIGAEAFSGCVGLTDVTFPNTVTNIGAAAFQGCTSLTRITFPNALTTIGYSAFQDCTGLLRLRLPDGVRSIGGATFSGCTSLELVTLGRSLDRLNDALFENCVSLEELVIPDSVVGVTPPGLGRTPVFDYCPRLRHVQLGHGLTNAPPSGWSYFFRNCPNLVSVTVDADHPTYRQSGGALYNRDLTSLEYVPTWRTGRYEVPEGVLRIADDAMGSCSKLTEVQLPETLQTIGSGAFFDCAQLQRIRIPDSVTRLGSFAFYNCSQLVEVVMGAGIQNIEESTFAGSGLKRISFGPLVSVIHADVLPDFAEGWGTSPLELYFHGNAPAVVGDMRPAGLAKLFYAGGTLGWTSDFHGIPATEWQVSVRAELATSPHDDFQMRTIVDGPAGMSCVVEAAENLSTPTWTRVGLVTLPTGGTSVFVDPDAARHSNRFYRVRMP